MSGRARILQAKGGGLYVFMSLCWEPEARRRSEEIGLMLGSLRLLGKAREGPTQRRERDQEK
jgi:hypothetical protein